MSGTGYLFPVIVIAGMVFISLSSFRRILRSNEEPETLAKRGQYGDSRCAFDNTNRTTINKMPEMLLSLRMGNTGGQSHTAIFKQLVDPGPTKGRRQGICADRF